MSDVKQHKKGNEDKQKRPNIFVRMGRWLKGVFSELGKVSWPSFRKVMKKTAIVLAVVSIFLVIIFLFDLGLGWLYNKMIKDLGEGTQVIKSLIQFGGV